MVGAHGLCPFLHPRLVAPYGFRGGGGCWVQGWGQFLTRTKVRGRIKFRQQVWGQVRVRYTQYVAIPTLHQRI
jgi:hypothetical protein